MRKNKNLFCRYTILFLIPWISAFSFFSPTWQSVNDRIARKFPEVKSISTDELAQIFDREDIYLIDVRKTEEFAVSSIKGAVNTESVTDVVESQDRKIVVYCSVGYRSAVFASRLQKAGYTRVFNLSGSIFDWANKGHPLFQGTRRTKYVHPFNDKWGALLNSKFHSYTPMPPSVKNTEGAL